MHSILAHTFEGTSLLSNILIYTVLFLITSFFLLKLNSSKIEIFLQKIG